MQALPRAFNISAFGNDEFNYLFYLQQEQQAFLVDARLKKIGRDWRKVTSQILSITYLEQLNKQ